MTDKLFRVPGENMGQRIDQFLAVVCPGNSRAYYQKLIRRKQVKLNEQDTDPRYRLKVGDKVRVHFPEAVPVNFGGTDLLDVLYEDTDILALNKPAGLVVHHTGQGTGTAAGTRAHTLADLLLSRYPEFMDGDRERPGIVHRLDKDTSGVMVIAKTPEAKFKVMKQFADRKTKKTYLCLVAGGFKEKTGSIDAPLIRDQGDRRKFRVGAGRNAMTEFKVIEPLSGDNSYLEVHPLTGRTHQIRVHLLSIGHPVLGDAVYAGARELAREYGFIKRQMLHAHRLELAHPVTGKAITFTAELPADFKTALKELRGNSTTDAHGFTRIRPGTISRK